MNINTFKQNWPITRILWLVLGIAVLIPSIIDQDIVGIIMGTFFAVVMGILKVGCKSNKSCCGNDGDNCGCN